MSDDERFGNTASFITRVPKPFFEAIGRVMVSHAWADKELSSVIFFLSGMDTNAGISVLSPVTRSKDRTDILRNLAKTKLSGDKKSEKLIILSREYDLLYEYRNIVAHRTPHSWSPTEGILRYAKDTQLTFPQITVKPMSQFTVGDLELLSDKFLKLGTWFGMILPRYVPDGIDMTATSGDELHQLIKQHGTNHPDWDDDDKFPWKEKLKKRKKSN